MKHNTPVIGIVGQTATGKTTLAVNLAYRLNGEIISADSRQVYCQMDIGTGKDLDEYTLNEKKIPYHLIDILPPGAHYDVFNFQKDFLNAYQSIIKQKKVPILCGGSGMYIDAVVNRYAFQKVPINETLRKQWVNRSDSDLINQLKHLKPLHNTTDITDRNRLERALEIAVFEAENSAPEFPEIPFKLFAVYFDRETLKKRITTRLKQRFEQGMIDEVRQLINDGVDVETLKYYGLEYKFIAMYLNNELNYNDMYQKLNSAIHQFSKRQLTFFRKMEKNGTHIHWINGKLPLNQKVDLILNTL